MVETKTYYNHNQKDDKYVGDDAFQNRISLIASIYPVFKQLSPDDIRLIRTKESLFNGSWESFTEKLKELVRLNPGLEEVIRRIEELKKLERESETDLACFLYVQIPRNSNF